MLDFIFNTENFLDDNIKFTTAMLEIADNTKKNILENQAKIVDLYAEIKNEDLKKQLEKQQGEAYAELLKLDKQREETQKILEGLEEIRNKII